MSMEEIILPKRFKEKLDNSDKKFNAIVTEILKNFEKYLNVSTLEFFPEYNNHGITHLNNIFKIQDELIPENSFLLSAEDITTLIIATLAHDIGMHVNYDGFLTLINSSQVWHEKWMHFFHLSKKYNESKLKELFGDTNPVVDLPQSKQDFKNRDYMLVGEFLRVNHPLLAEYILKHGFPIANNEYQVLSNQLIQQPKILAFSSLLAKSHGMEIRDTYDEVQQIGNAGDFLYPHNTHIIYLMVILRLSDYLDIYENRHPKILIGLKNFISSMSKFEWDKNTSVTEIKDHWKDTEAIFIGVEPNDSLSFINLKNLFKSIQYELDISWAVLGEIYSKEDSLKNFGIKYRRVLSNIDNEKTFREKVKYIPRKIAFNSDPDLLKLLIAPLYGDNPSYGVRELLQNAVDACKEYQELTGELYKPVISLNAISEKNTYYFEIIDNGLGMTEDTIVNYFLKAGASFRNSDFWNEKLKDENNKAKVVRTGRFGIGLLAAFLFGTKIEVKTKHYTSALGYTFKTHLSDPQINILIDNDISIGTSIKIEMNKDVYTKLINSNWKEWYKLNDITILYNEKMIEKTINEENYIVLNQNDYTSVKWFYENTSNELCICNGFRIPNANLSFESSIDFPSGNSKGNGIYSSGSFNAPTILFTDKEGALPLNLNRNSFLDTNFSFSDELVKAISKKLFNDLLEYKINKNDILKSITYINPITNNKSNYFNYDLTNVFIFNKNGFSLFNSFTIEKNNIDKLIYIELNDKIDENRNIIVNQFLCKILDETGACIKLRTGEISANSNGYNNLLEVLAGKTIKCDKNFRIQSANIMIPKENHSKIFTYKNTAIKVGLKDGITTSDNEIKRIKGVIPSSEDSDFWSKNYFLKENNSVFDLKILDEYIDDIGLIAEIHIDNKKPKENDVEYYFSHMMEEHFKEEENAWIAYQNK